MPNRNKTQRIVLIDDSADDRAKFRGALLRGAPDRRYQIREASNGEEALDLCKSDPDWPIDCIVTDVHMPRMNGLDLLKQLKVDGEDFLPVPVIVLTGTSDENEEATAALSLGAQDYITKNGLHHTTLFRSIDNAIERHAMLKKLRESERAAEAATRAKSALIGNISHEIRTPMTAVLGLCDVLLTEDIPEKHRPMLKMIRDNGSYLVEIVNDLLDLSKIEAGMLDIEPEPLNFPSFLQDMIQLMQVRATENQTSLRLESSDLPEAIEADAVRLRQILLNLISNAIKFSPNGEVVLKVSRLTNRNSDSDNQSQLQFVVSDTGCGIPEEDLEAIFHPFIQSAGSTRHRSAGTGLGLSICRRLCEAMKGTIGVTSQVNVGSTFTVTLPLVEAVPIDDDPTEKCPLSRPIEELLADCRVLVAEDTRATQVLIRHLLEKAGCQVTIVEDGKQLVETLKNQAGEFNVVLSDVQMPELSGLDATKMIRDLGIKIPVLVLTADAVQETRDIALANGANDVVTKPIHRDELLNQIARMLDEQNANT